jgi:hypothetical protein
MALGFKTNEIQRTIAIGEADSLSGRSDPFSKRTVAADTFTD